MLSEIAPFPAVASHLVGIIETHFDQAMDRNVSLISNAWPHLKLETALRQGLTGGGLFGLVKEV